MNMSLYKCPVCSMQLIKIDRTYKCQNKHSYDLSKKDYVNLILANQGHSLNEGDSKEMVESRRNFLQGGYYSLLRNKLVSIIQNLFNHYSDIVSFLDVACGEGYYTNFIHNSISLPFGISSYGVDISKNAIHYASSQKKIQKLNNISYSVGNMDYLPFLNNSFDVLLNCFAPINEKEFYRVLKNNSYFIRVLPGRYHLQELKEFLYSEVRLNEPKSDEISGFFLENSYQLDDTITIENEQIQNLFTMTTYYYKTSFEAKEKLKNLDSLTTKISFIIKVYKKI